MKLIISYLKENAVIDFYECGIDQMMVNINTPGKPESVFICDYNDMLAEHPPVKKFIEDTLNNQF